MNKPITFIFVLLVLFASGANPPKAVAAPATDQASITFSDLGLDTDIILRGPYDSNGLRFSLPAAWVLLDGVELELEVSTFISGETGTNLNPDNNFLGALLEVYFNNRLQQIIPLEKGDKVLYRIPIRASDLDSPFTGGWYDISFFLDAAIDCDFDFYQTTVIIGPSSKAHLSYTEIPPSLSLHQLPWPIYQQRANIIEPVIAVVPTSPTEDELQASLIVLGSFGRMTSGDLPVSMVTADQVTEEIRNKNNMIFIGKPSAFSLLKDMKLPIPVDTDSFSSPEVIDGDGVLEIFPSPWNSSKAILLVSGTTDEGVVKAAQALSTRNLQTGTLKTYSVIAKVNPNINSGVTTTNGFFIASPDIELADLGLPIQTISGVGTNYVTYEFSIPQGLMPSESPYLELVHSSSVLVDPERSNIEVYLNNVLVGSVKLDSENSTLTTSKVDLPKSAFTSGLNVIEIVVNLIPLDECAVVSISESGLWMTVYPESKLHVPLVPVETVPSVALGDLNAYPLPFAGDSTYSTTAFVLPEQSIFAWSIAGSVAYDLGASTSSSILAFEAYYDSQFTEDVRIENLIIIGEPKKLKIVSGLKSALPAYFEENSNIAILESQQVIYRISDEKSLGYLELFASPWSEKGAILGIFGTTDNGLKFAGDALLKPNMRETLVGNFVTIDSEKTIVVDTLTGLGVGRVGPELGSEVVSRETPEAVPPALVMDNEAAQSARRQLIFYGIAGIVVLMVVVAIVALVFRKRNL